MLKRLSVRDSRGFLERLYCANELAPLLSGRAIVQVNRTITVREGTVRGMHFQHSPHAETKFVTCLRGAVFDVAVDLRADSPTFLRWHAEQLSADNARTLVIPEGFAHGFQTMTADCEMLYFHTAVHSPDAEGGLCPTDPRLAIDWPRRISEMSRRDARHPLLDDTFAGLGA